MLVLLALATSMSAGPALTLGIEPETLVAGESASVTLRARGADIDQLTLQVEVGSLGALEAAPDGSVSARWTLPAALTPRRIAAVAIDRVSRTPVFRFLAVSRRARFEVRSRPGAQVEITLDDASLASTTASDDGTAILNVLIEAGTDGRASIAHRRVDGGVEKEAFDLGVRDALHLWTVGADHHVYIVGYRDSGAPLAEPTLRVRAAGSSLDARETSFGVWTARLDGEGSGPVLVSSELVARSHRVTHEIAVASAAEPAGTAAGFALGVGAGLVTELDAVTSPIGVAELAWTPGWLNGHLALQFSVGFYGASSSAPTGAAGVSDSVYWLVPITVGASYAWPLGPDWVLDAGLGTGATPYAGSTERHNPQGKNQKPKDNGGAVWHLRVGAGGGYRLGPGWLRLDLGIGVLLTLPEAWPGQRVPVGLTAGYRFDLPW